MTESPARLLREFHAYVGADIQQLPVPNARGGLERWCFVDEECQELRTAIERQDIAAIADALGDLAYVVYGTALHFGIDLDRVVAEIHRSNMTKTPAGNGKAVKGPGYTPPVLDAVLSSGF